MAATRKRSRISDTPIVQDAHSQAAAAAQLASPDGDFPVTRSTKGFCKKCSAQVGEFYNGWVKITGTYYLPALLGSYNSLLRESGRQKAASLGTALNGCHIQPLSCPRCPEILGFTVVDAPKEKHSYSHRDFFKLPRIELKCEHAGKFKLVDPLLDPVPDQLQQEDSKSPPSEMEVELAAPAAAPHHPPPQLPHPPYRHNSPVPAVATAPPHQQNAPASKTALPSPVLPSAPLPPPRTTLAAFIPPTAKDSGVNLANRFRDRDYSIPPVLPSSPNPAHKPNGQHYPNPQEVQFDAISRLQTQIGHNTANLQIQARDIKRQGGDMQNQLQFQHGEIKRVEDAVNRLQHEMRGVHEMLESIRMELHSRPMTGAPPPPPPPPSAAQDSALELLANNLAMIGQKVNEVDTLKMTIEIMRGKLKRLEETGAASSSSHAFPSPREPSAHSAHSTHTVSSYHGTPSTVPDIATPIRPDLRLPSTYHPTPTPDQPHSHTHALEPEAKPTGWVSVNSSAKRGHPNGIEGPHEIVGQPIGSPKRPKLAPIEPRMTYEAKPHAHALYDRMDTSDSETRGNQSHPQSQTQLRESLTESSATPSTFIPYSTQEPNPEDSWHSEPQHASNHPEHRSPRSRGRGGPSSRGGRSRKSIPVDSDLGTPEWEKEDLQGAGSQTSPDGHYNPVTPGGTKTGRGLVRRGSGGGGTASRSSRPTSSAGRAVSMGLQGVTPGPGVGIGGDPYAHTKKTRTKPIRNAEGILIRKDGRPDMRSQSSAANLRKVHAKKEEAKAAQRQFTPTSSLATSRPNTMGVDTPSPTAGAEGAGPSTQHKHQLIMKQMFPHGVDEARARHDYSKQLFAAGGSPLEMKIKREEETRRVEEISPADNGNGTDVDMDHGDDEQTPSQDEDQSGASDGANRAHVHESRDRDTGGDKGAEDATAGAGTDSTNQSTAQTLEAEA